MSHDGLWKALLISPQRLSRCLSYLSSEALSWGCRNLRGLANIHDKVMVLFCDVVGFTSMSKEVEASQVCEEFLCRR